MKEKEITKITLKNILSSGLILSPLVLNIAIPDNFYITNICCLYPLLAILVMVSAIIITSSEEVKEGAYNNDTTKSYDIYSIVTDGALVMLLAASGFIFSAGTFVIGLFLLYGIKNENRRKRKEARKTSPKKSKKNG